MDLWYFKLHHIYVGLSSIFSHALILRNIWVLSKWRLKHSTVHAIKTDFHFEKVEYYPSVYNEFKKNWQSISICLFLYRERPMRTFHSRFVCKRVSEHFAQSLLAYFIMIFANLFVYSRNWPLRNDIAVNFFIIIFSYCCMTSARDLRLRFFYFYIRLLFVRFCQNVICVIYNLM